MTSLAMCALSSYMRQFCEEKCATAERFLALGRFPEAVELCLQASDLDPTHSEPLSVLSSIFVDSGLYGKARVSAECALERNPRDITALVNLAIALIVQAKETGDPRFYARATELAGRCINLARPDNARLPSFHILAGIALSYQFQATEAAGHFEKALTLDPANHLGQLCRSACQSLMGQMSALAKRSVSVRRPVFHPEILGRPTSFGPADIASLADTAWEGEPLAGRTLLVRSTYDGLGDLINFARYFPMIAGGRAVVQCTPRIAPLMARSFPSICVTTDEGFTDFDCSCGTMDLPRLCKTTLDTIPANVPYISVGQDHVERWGREIAGLSDPKKFRVGIVWGCSSEIAFRNAPSHLFFSLADVPGVQLFSFQRTRDGKHPEPVPDGVICLEREDTTLEDTAAALLSMNLLISVDTLQVHLGGALGIPVWNLLSHFSDWRWFDVGREDTRWYPSMRLFWQPKPGDWVSVLARVKKELALEAQRPRRLATVRATASTVQSSGTKAS